MATLPRARNKHATSITSPFSTSPRKLQEMALPATDGHDVTSSSGVSMKQFEEQLSSLRKENFHLKLRIYFLEEKLGTGAPPAVQGLLEHNVRLQVEVEELRRQLNDKQQLLAAAAEAIDVLEQQGSVSVSTDSVDVSLHNNNSAPTHAHKLTDSLQEVEIRPGAADDTCAESESPGDYLAVTVNNDELDELERLRRENRKALQMIKECTKKIQQQNKEMKKIKLDKESESQLDKHAEVVRCKDEHIRDLERRLRDLQNGQQHDDTTAGNLQQLLTRRLQGLAYFLDKLLAHKCVLGEDKRRLVESILEQSLALPVGLELDESMAPGDLTLDESEYDASRSMRIEELTAMFGHHLTCCEDNDRPSEGGPVGRRPPPVSESEWWSEPDRDVSLARVGLSHAGIAPVASASRARRVRPHVEEEKLRAELAEAKRQAETAERRAADAEAARAELEATAAETERSLRRAADEAAVHASQAALERARAHRDLLRAERERDDARDRLAAVTAVPVAPPPPVVPALPSDEERPTSPDQGIDSDRLSSLEQYDAGALSPRSLYAENVTLKQKLSRTKATLAHTLAQLNAANARKRSVQRAICREIHKTHGVLRHARDQLDLHQHQH